MVLGEFLGVWAWGLFFCGMNGGRDERTDSLPAGWGIGAALDVGGVSFWGFVVRGLGIEAVLDRVWCFCVIFKFIFGVFWIIIMEKDGWPD